EWLMDFQTNRKRMVNFSTISLTDIVLLLLIFFLLSSSFIVQPGIKVRLPKATSAQVEPGDRIYITITSQGLLFVNQERVLKNDLGAKLKLMLSQGKEKLVVIKADKELTLEKTIEIVDIARLAGAEKFMIATQPGL
ncbi:MAG: biopolymer transporter ExbD, partial [candidate division KSB1 bacterium]|nr:biopolymer transporter ExbD [candidate division KSB1 bacterium]